MAAMTLEQVRVADVADLAGLLLGLPEAVLLPRTLSLLRPWWPARSG